MFLLRMVRRVFVAFLIITVVGYGALEFAAKSFAEGKLEELAVERNRLAQGAEAKVSVPLLYGILVNSRIRRVEIATTQVDLGPFVADRASAVLRTIELDRMATLLEREPVIESIDVVEMALEFNSAQASKVLPEGFSFEFLPTGKVRLIGPGTDITGQLVIAEGPVIRFDPEGGSVLPPGVGNLVWTFTEVPFVTCVAKIEIIAPLARITCTERDPPAKFPPGLS